MRNSHWGYWLCLPALLFVLFGSIKIYALSRDNHSVQSSIQTNQTDLTSLKRTERQTNLNNYNITASQNGTNLYRNLPRLDSRIQDTLSPIYTKISTQKDYDRIAPKIQKPSQGSLVTTALRNARPQPMQGQKQALSPYSSIKNVRIDNKYSNYNQGNIIVLSDVSYTLPGQTVSGGNSIKLPSYVQHDYYVSSYNFATQRLDSITTTHSQSKGDE